MMNGMYSTSMFARKPMQQVWQVGIYCRLSKDDELQGESASIGNQRELLTNVCNANGWKIVEVFQDDGYTGLNMERPGLKRLLQAVEQGRINLVITKDLSRLGRNYLQTGHLMEDFFPRHGTRYVAFNDNIDTVSDSNDIAPFKNILNEMYSKDISKKVHSSYMVAAEKGRFTGTVAPFGYKKDPDQKGHLLIDEETAPFVRTIFDMAAAGHGPNYIRHRLEAMKVPCPSWWNRQRGFRATKTKWETKDSENGSYMWDFSVLKDMLMNPVYIGSISSQKKHYRFKIGTISDKKPDEWIVVENCHEPIIDRTTFDIVQRSMGARKRSRSNGNYSLFCGLLKCGNCGKSLTYRIARPGRDPYPCYCCKTYNAYGKSHCTQHRVNEDMLRDVVLENIRTFAKAAEISQADIMTKLQRIADGAKDEQQESYVMALAKDEDRMGVLDRMVSKLYEDYMAGSINESNFNMMLDRTQKEQKRLTEHMDELHKMVDSQPAAEDTSQQWLDLITQYKDITELDADTLNRLINQIVVFEEIDADHVRHLRVEIHFNFQPVPGLTEYTPKEQRPYLHPDHTAQYAAQ